ncbi:late competence development ComFB family protein [Tissierella sp.]|uniref:late competence development ComFB family protein n=1 Tax=Tissierella sp. TaxID=41274 RepID=UPI002855BCA3|nr:late competence development ComFB family protein [Tissierella sp.]MDR7857595.1 late competence development ComFB family protein [Tissierella sp.]
MIKNYMELIVDEIYSEIRSLYHNCDMNKCEHDIKSIALTNLPPVYFKNDITEGEKMAFLLERQRRITVLAKVAEAADSVCANCNIIKK